MRACANFRGVTILASNRSRGPEDGGVVFDPAIMAMHESQFAAHQPSFITR